MDINRNKEKTRGCCKMLQQPLKLWKFGCRGDHWSPVPTFCERRCLNTGKTCCSILQQVLFGEIAPTNCANHRNRRIRPAAAGPRRLRQSTGLSLRAAFRIQGGRIRLHFCPEGRNSGSARSSPRRRRSSAPHLIIQICLLSIRKPHPTGWGFVLEKSDRY